MAFSVRRPVVCLAVLGFVGAAAIAGCSGGYANSGYNSAGLQCGAPKGQYALVYPAPGSTGIPDALPEVVFGSTNGLASSYQAIVQPAGSASYVFGGVAPAPSPIPTPDLVPSFANPIYQASASLGAVLPAATQISVYINDGSSNCSPTLTGTFTTQ